MKKLVSVRCPNCDGCGENSGCVDVGWTNCTECGGSGRCEWYEEIADEN